MKIDVSSFPESYQCPELPLGLTPAHLTLEVDGVEAPTAFAVDTDQSLVKWYKTTPGTFALEMGEDNRPIVMETKYRKFTVRWDNCQGVTGELTFQGKN